MLPLQRKGNHNTQGSDIQTRLQSHGALQRCLKLAANLFGAEFDLNHVQCQLAGILAVEDLFDTDVLRAVVDLIDFGSAGNHVPIELDVLRRQPHNDVGLILYLLDRNCVIVHGFPAVDFKL